MYRRQISACLIAMLCAAAVPSWGWAQETEQEQAVHVAQKLFEEGAKAYSEKKYADAVTLFRKAYTYVPAAAFLYNAAKAAERLGNLEQALSLAKQAMAQKEQTLPAAMAKKDKELIESLKARISAEKAEAERRRTMQWSWVGYSGIGVGVVGLGLTGGAVYLGTQASSDIEALGEIQNPSVYAQKRDDVLTKQSTGQVLLYSGVGLMAAGAGMVAWDLLSPGESPFSVAAGPGDIGLSFNAKF